MLSTADGDATCESSALIIDSATSVGAPKMQEENEDFAPSIQGLYIIIYIILPICTNNNIIIIIKERKTFFFNEQKSRDAAAKKYRYKRSRDK